MNEFGAASIAALIGIVCWWFTHIPLGAIAFGCVLLFAAFCYNLATAEIRDLQATLDMEAKGWRQVHGPSSGWGWLSWREKRAIRKRKRGI
jgi:hypothetical protein